MTVKRMVDESERIDLDTAIDNVAENLESGAFIQPGGDVETSFAIVLEAAKLWRDANPGKWRLSRRA